MPTTTLHTLAIDIGGSGVKASVLDEHGKMLHERVRIDSPIGAHPDDFTAAIAAMVGELPPAQQIAVGFPGMVRNGVVLTAPNLGHDAWRGYDLAQRLASLIGSPVRVANDADVQGFAVIAGKGLEMVVTLGTGFGTALYQDGRLCPHLELSHHPFRKGESYDEQLGNATRKKIGNKHWQKRVLMAIDTLRELTHFDRIYVGGGNARKLEGELPDDVTIVDNQAGIEGGAALWRD